MFVFAPPVKVPRTQRQSVSSHSGPAYASIRSTEELGQVQPSSVRTGRHMAWLVDEDTRLLRVWNLSQAGWQRSAPRLDEVPRFMAAEEGLPLFVCAMDDEEESLAFCSERGTVSSLDHSVEFQLIDSDEAVPASCFACVRRSDCGEVVITVVGTESGTLVIDVKKDGEHVTNIFDRRHSRILAGNTGKPPSKSWWASVKRFVVGSNDDGAVAAPPDPMQQERSSACDAADPAADSSVEPCDAGENAVGSLRFTHVVPRRSYPSELVAANAAGEILLVDFGASDEPDAEVVGRWCTDLRGLLNTDGEVVAVAESRHKVAVLLCTRPHQGSRALPSLMLATLHAASGTLVNVVVVNSVPDVVKAAKEVPHHHIKLYVDDISVEVVLLIKNFCIRVNNQVGVRSACSSEDTIVFNGASASMGAVLLQDDSVVALNGNGPVLVLENVHDRHSVPQQANHASSLFAGAAAVPGCVDADRRLADVLAAARVDGRMTLDEAVLTASEDIYLEHAVSSRNWARADLNAEDDNLALHVTRKLRSRQQAHRQFVMAALNHEEVGAALLPSTKAQLISAQEALLGLLAVRSLQNVGTLSSLHAKYDCAMPLVLQHTQESFSVREADMERSMSFFPASKDGAAGTLKVIDSASQLMRCQRIVRQCLIRVADRLRQSSGEAAAVAASTAAELFFSSPAHVVLLLRELGTYLVSVRQSAVVSLAEKFAEANAVACVYVVVAQAVVESREDLKACCAVPPEVKHLMWTNSQHPATGVELAFAQICTTLTSILGDTLEAPPSPSPAHQQQLSAEKNEESMSHGEPDATVTVGDQCGTFDLAAYLLFFSFVCKVNGTPAYYSNALQQTFLRQPFVFLPHGRLGYPYGRPTAPRYAPEIGSRALQLCERLALVFDASEVLMAFCLASPVEDPTEEGGKYELLERFCLVNPRVYRFAMEHLLREHREWELLCLPSLLPRYGNAALERDRFLAEEAPHLLWLAAPQRFDALVTEGEDAAPYVAYGPTQLSHRQGALALGRLAWVAAGSPTSARFNDLALKEAVVTAQARYLSPDLDNFNLAPQQLVQRLLELPEVSAWVAAAEVAVLVEESLGDDLLVQILRRCRAKDGDALALIASDSISELETVRAITATAVGQLVSTSAVLHQRLLLTRLCETVLTPQETRLLLSWLTMY